MHPPDDVWRHTDVQRMTLDSVEQPPSQWWTRADAAQFFGRHVNTIDRWIRDGDLPAFYIGGTVRIPESACREKIERDTKSALRRRRAS